MTLKNEDLSLAHTLRVTVENPYHDLIVGFVGTGSVDDGEDYFVLEPGRSQPVVLAIHAQDAGQQNYNLTLKVVADEGSNDEIVDYASLSIRVLKSDQFELALLATNPNTLVQTYVVTNTGRPITDLHIRAIDPTTGLPARALIQPTMEHAYLASLGQAGSTRQFEVIPLFSPEDAIGLEAFARMGRTTGLASPLSSQEAGIQVQVIGGAGGATQTISQTLGCSAPNQLYALTQHNVRLQFTNQDWYCTNRPNVDLNLATPGSIHREDILGATLSSYFAPKSDGLKPHNMQLYFNPSQIGSFNNTIPTGSYLFDVNPADFRAGTNPAGIVNQVIGIRSQHPNGGHYALSNGNRLDLVLDQYTCYVCAANESQARSLGCYGVLPNPTNLQIEITQPAGGANLTLNQPTNLTAQVNDSLSEQIPYPVEALITYSDIISGGAPVQERLVLPYQEPQAVTSWDPYQTTWTPAYTGDVSITAIVDATTISNTDTIEVSINPEPTDLQVEVPQPVVPATYGQPVTVEAVVTNQGGAVGDSFDVVFNYYKPAEAPTANAAFTTWTAQKGTLVLSDTVTINGLAANSTQTITSTFTPSTEDINTWFIVEVEVDPESN